eukprot:763312-Hanusia_phi.AAC.5
MLHASWVYSERLFARLCVEREVQGGFIAMKEPFKLISVLLEGLLQRPKPLSSGCGRWSTSTTSSAPSTSASGSKLVQS